MSEPEFGGSPVQRHWEYRRRVQQIDLDMVEALGGWIEEDSGGVCRACGRRTELLDEWNVCEECGDEPSNEQEWEDDPFDRGESFAPGAGPLELVSEGYLSESDLATGTRRRLDHRLPPDARDWDSWTAGVGNDLYFFQGPCRMCGRPTYYQDLWDTCRACAERNPEALWAR